MLDTRRLALANIINFARACGLEPDEKQAEVLRSKERRMILNWCRQSGKSSVASIRALHAALYHDRSFVLIFSPSLDQSIETFRKIADYYGRLGYTPADADRLLRMGLELPNGSRIEARPGSERTSRGRTADLLIIDEASRIDDELYTALRPSLIVSRGRLIMTSTPFGKRGVFWETWERGVGWWRSQMTAYECPRISDEDLEAERRSMLDHEFRREYLVEFDDAAQRSLFGTMADIEAAFISLDDAPEWQTGSLMTDPSEDLDALSVGDRRFWQALHERWYG